MQIQTLEELKAENAKAEEETVEESVPETEETEVEAVEETEEETQEIAESTEESESEESIEAWMQEEEQASEESSAKFTGSDIKAARMKERAKAEKRHNREIEELKAEIALLKQPQQSVAPSAAPKLEDYGYDEAKYQQALTEHLLSTVDKRQDDRLEQARQEQQRQALAKKVDDHYDRAAELIKQHGIDPQVYKQADADFRDAIEEIVPDRGDLYADGIIASLGDGSEKALYHLAKNKAKLRQFQNKLASDPSGIQASIYLGQLLAEVTRPIVKKANAPKPATKLNGGTGTSVNESSMVKRYKEAHKKGDIQAAFDIKRKAKQSGVNTRDW